MQKEINMNDTYLLIEHKPYSSDYCKGCLMDSYEEDTQVFIFDDIDKLCAKIVEAEEREIDGTLGYNEAGNEHTILFNGIPIIEGESLCIEDLRNFKMEDKKPYADVINKISETLSRMIIEYKKEKVAREEREKERKEQEQRAEKAKAKLEKEQREKESLKRLAEKYPDELKKV